MFGKKSKEKKPVNKEELKLSIADKALSVIWVAAGGVLVYFGMKCGEKTTSAAISRGLEKSYDKGLIKFFDLNGKEMIGFDAANEALKDAINKGVFK